MKKSNEKVTAEVNSIEGLLKRLKFLEELNDNLTRDNERLEVEKMQLAKQVSVLSEDGTEFRKPRVLSKDISNYDKAEELFSLKAVNDTIISDANSMHNNFGVFYQNIFRALNPTTRCYNGKQSLIYTPINQLSDEEYNIYCTVLEDVIEVIYNYKKQIKAINH